MVNTAAHHVYVDGAAAALQFLAEAELFLRDPSVGLDGATTYHLLDHLYNWHQFAALMPYGRPGLLELLEEIKHSVATDDRAALLATVRELTNVLEGDLQAPDLD